MLSAPRTPSDPLFPDPDAIETSFRGRSMLQNDPISKAIKHYEAGDFQQAEASCRQILRKNKSELTAMVILGRIATAQGRFKEAISIYTKVVDKAPKEVDYHVLLAETYATAGRHKEALARYERALKLKKAHPPALAGKANVLTRTGEWDKARALLEPIVIDAEEDAGIAAIYARIETHFGNYMSAVDVAMRHTNDRIPNEFKRRLWFDAGKAWEKAERFDEAFNAYAEGNRVNRGRWDPRAEANRYDDTVRVFSREGLDAMPIASDPSEIPVFIVGMLRSGSTLTEQIIDAHPDAYGAGEVLFLPDIVDRLNLIIGSTAPYPDAAADMDQADVDTLAGMYLKELKAVAPKAARICDKYLGSYEHMGLISRLFPTARIIHTRRNPIDTCLSCFVQRFAPGVPAYTEDLEELGMLYNDYRYIVQHWRDTGIEMLEIDYEDLVGDLEATVHRILDYVGLDFHENCLRFYETKREVLTLSREQVNKPIYASSVERWRRFEAHLQPLIETLESGRRGNG